MNTVQRIAISGSSPVIPGGMCCNCGTKSAVDLRSTTLVRATAMVIPGIAAVGEELRLALALPYCPECANTSERIAPTMGKKFWLWFMWLWIILFAEFCLIMALGIPIENGHGTTVVLFGTPGILAAIGEWLLYSRRKPKGSQTSFYQAVGLGRPKRKLFGQTARVVFAFTNGAYAEQFLQANPGAEKV